jgi:hypothetical protein
MKQDFFIGVQTFLVEAGESACYALAIIKLATKITGKYFPVVETLNECIERKYIYFNLGNQNDDNNFFVNDPAKMLSHLTGIRWSIEKCGADYKAKIDEWIVQRWERVRTGSTTGHFRLPDWDSLVNSQTVKYGKIVSTRVFRKA